MAQLDKDDSGAPRVRAGNGNKQKLHEAARWRLQFYTELAARREKYERSRESADNPEEQSALLKDLKDFSYQGSKYIDSFIEDHIGNLWGELDFHREIGKKIRLVRKHYQMTQGEFADLLGVTQATVSRWEKGHDIPSNSSLLTLSYLIDVIDPQVLLRSPMEPTSDGNLVPEIPVKIIGEIIEGQYVTFWKKEHFVPVSRPREGRPRRDVVGIAVSDNTNRSGIFLNSGWVLFYPSEYKGDPQDHINELCIVKFKDEKNFFLQNIRKGYEEGKYNTMSINGVLRENIEIEWASPIVSMRQGEHYTYLPPPTEE